MGITGKELAARLGLSEAAVSVALNGKSGISEKKREEILRLARENGYDFSRLKNTYTESVHLLVYLRHGAIVGDTPFFNILLKGADTACQQHQLNLFVKYCSSVSEICAYLKSPSLQAKTGVIILGTELTETEMQKIYPSPVPLVVLDTKFNGIPANYVCINNQQGAFNATMHLIDRFKVQPGYLRSSYSIPNFMERADGFYQAVRSVGMSSSRSIVHYLSPSIEGAYHDMLEILRGGEPLARCYFADNDLIAAGAIKAMTENGHRVPKDIAVVGFDNIPLCTLMKPALSSIHVPKEYLSFLAIERLIDIMKKPNQPPTAILLATDLIPRVSSELR